MEERIQIRVEGTVISRLSVERINGNWGVMIQDPTFGSFPAEGLKLEISKDGYRWYCVTEHELVALMVS